MEDVPRGTMDEVSSHVCLVLPSTDGKAARKIVPPRLRIPYWKGLGADSEEKHEPVSDIDTVVVDSLKALDPKRPIREGSLVPSPDCLASFARCVLSCEGLGAGIEDGDEGALMGFAGSMRANCCPSQLGFAGAWVTPSGISTQGSFSGHQICRLGATQLGSSSVPALMNAIAPSIFFRLPHRRIQTTEKKDCKHSA